LLCAPSKKGDHAGTEGVLGSTALVGAVDGTILLSRDKENNRTIKSEMRYGEDLEETLLVFDKDTGTFELGGLKREAEGADLQDRILELLQSSKDPVHYDQIKEEIGGNASKLSRALKQVVKNGKAMKTGSGKKGDPHLYSVKSEVAVTVIEGGK
jgi:predicted Rossmann fold nucleotide-binding protein DprA/Smf involved in DNA uptake